MGKDRVLPKDRRAGSDPRECSLDCFLTYRVLDRLPNDSETKTLGRIAQRVAVHGTP
jgi:hypothetical protein